LHKRWDIHPAYGPQIRFSIIQQVILAILAILVMDEGQTSHGMAAVLLGYWLGIAIILVRRPLSPTKGDLLYVRWGCSLMAAAMLFVGFAVVLFRG
jgi:hypothetical protein